MSGSLESFGSANWQIGTGARESISKIKAPKLRFKTDQKISGITQKTETQVNTLFTLAKSPDARRFGLHSLVAVAIAAVVISGSTVGRSQVSFVTRPAGLGAALDEASAASVAATVAEKTNLAVASIATQTASTLNAQVALPTAGDDYLAKRQVVTTTGADSHNIITYAVGDGDTLSAIANKFNVTTDTILWTNNMGNADAIKPGQKLTILPVSGLLYTVQGGDTADSIANKYQANAAQIVSFNNAEVTGLAPGSTIVIPDGVKAAAPTPAPISTRIAASSSSSGSKLLPRLNLGSNGYAFGYCTYWVASRRYVPISWGNAASWYYMAKASGYAVGSAPAVGAIAWTPAGYYGHVAYVESVSGGQVTVSEMNYGGGWDRVDYRTTSASDFRYIY